jgi:TetR/AcrR family transcriptional repressor of nem operon
MGRNKSYNRGEVAEKALEVFWEKGFERTSLRDLEAATGVNRYGLYDSFKDKEGLFRECLEQYCAGTETKIGECADAGIDGLLGMFGRFAESNPEDAHARHGCMAITSLLEQDNLSPEVQTLLGDFIDKTLENVRCSLLREQETGKLRADLDLDECVAFVHMCLVGLPTMSRSSDAARLRLSANAAMTTIRSWRT